MRSLAGGLLAVVGGIAPIGAVGAQQTVAGRVIAADSVTPIAGAIIELSLGRRRLAQTLTTSTGEFRLRVADAGSLSVRVLRIGFRPHEITLDPIRAGETRHITIVVVENRVSLASMRVSARERCVTRSDHGASVAAVWEEARKAMLASRLVAATQPMLGEWFTYDRTMDSTGRALIDQRVRTHRLPTTHVFRSVSPHALAALGFVLSNEEGFEFFAPDPEVLLSDAFAATHCFRLIRGSGSHSEDIGIAFVPVRARDDQHEVEGTIWVARISSELRSVEFAYTGFPRLDSDVAAGGIVRFVRLQTGNWIVSEWKAQVPLLTISRGASAVTELGPRRLAPTSVVREVRVAGGGLERATVNDSIVFFAPRPAVRVEVRTASSAVPRAGTVISIRGTEVSAITDDRGRAQIGPLPLASYRLSVTVPVFDSIGAAPLQYSARATMTDTPTVIQLPDIGDILKRLCGSDTATIGSGILRGAIRERTGEPVRDAVVVIAFNRVDASTLRTGSVRWKPAELRASTDENGRWQFCGIPRETDIHLIASRGAKIASRRVRIDRIRSLMDVSLELSEPPPH